MPPRTTPWRLPGEAVGVSALIVQVRSVAATANTLRLMITELVARRECYCVQHGGNEVILISSRSRVGQLTAGKQKCRVVFSVSCHVVNEHSSLPWAALGALTDC